MRWFGTGIKIFVVVIELFLIRSLKMANSKSLSITSPSIKSVCDVNSGGGKLQVGDLPEF